MEIQYEYNVSDLFIGIEDTDEDHVLQEQSAEAFEEMLTAALKSAYPHAEISVIGHDNVTGWAKGISVYALDCDIRNASIRNASEIVENVWQSFDWVAWED